MNRFLWTMMLPCVVGCTVEVSEPTAEPSDEGRIGMAQSAMLSYNKLAPNALYPNGVLPNGVLPNSLVPTALTSGTLSAQAMDCITDPGPPGELSRTFMQYVVSCALDQSQTFDFVWTDSQNVPHDECFPGVLGLAPEWTEGPLSENKQHWISACLAARTNYFGVSVLVSMRGSTAVLDTTQEERDAYTHREGAFWGNLFDTDPYLNACYNESDSAYPPTKQRVCATGYDDGTTVHECGILDTIGPCNSVCTLAVDPAFGYTECEGMSQVITTFLN